MSGLCRSRPSSWKGGTMRKSDEEHVQDIRNRLTPTPILVDEPIGGVHNQTKKDLAGLGFGEYADVLAGVILGSASPFTMGVFGDWGTGKTTLMQMIRERLMAYIPRENPKDGGYPTIIPVWFDAWRYERETDLIGPLLGAMLDAAQDHAAHPNGERLVEALGTAFRTLVSSVSVKLPVMEISGKEFVEQYDRFVDRLALPGSTEYRTAYRILQETIEEFAAPANKAKPNNKFVIFVDDLDRCLPEAALQVLECTKVFLGFKGMVWVLGLKREIVENCIMERYRSKDKGGEDRFPYGADLGKQYLQKIIQVPFTIPKGTADEMAQVPDHLGSGEQLPAELSGDFLPIVPDTRLPDDRRPLYSRLPHARDVPEFVQSYHVATHYLERKPRELKRLLNAYIVSSQITRKGFGEDADEKHQPMLTLALLILRFLDQGLYERLTAEPITARLVLFWRVARTLGLEVPKDMDLVARWATPEDVVYRTEPDGDAESPEQSRRPQKREAVQPQPLKEVNGEKIAEFLLVTRLLEADPADIESHARATSATVAPEEAPAEPAEEGLVDRALRVIRSGEREGRAEAAQTLGEWFHSLSPPDRAVVRDLANDGAPEVRAGLAEGLGRIHFFLKTEGRVVVEHLANDEAQVRAALARGLGRNFHRLEDEGRGILYGFAEAREHEVRAAVAQGLGVWYQKLDAEGRGIVDRLAKDVPEVRFWVAWGLGFNFGNLDAEGRGIVDRLAEDVPEVRKGLIRGLNASFVRGEEGDRLLEELERRQAEEGEEA